MQVSIGVDVHAMRTKPSRRLQRRVILALLAEVSEPPDFDQGSTRLLFPRSWWVGFVILFSCADEKAQGSTERLDKVWHRIL
jgi:hypothetical protein